MTRFGIFITPVFYYVIQWLKDLRPTPPEDEDNQMPHVSPEANGRGGHG